MNFKFLFALFLGCSLFGQVTTIPNNEPIKNLPTDLNNNFSWLVTKMVTKSSALVQPGAPVVTVHGTPGLIAYGYTVAACNVVGCTAGSTETTISTGAASLTGSNYNSVATAAISSSTSCGVWRTTSPTFLTQGLISVIPCGNTVNDTGLPILGSTSFLGYLDGTAGVAIDRLHVGNNSALGSTSSNAILDSTSTATTCCVTGIHSTLVFTPAADDFASQQASFNYELMGSHNVGGEGYGVYGVTNNYLSGTANGLVGVGGRAANWGPGTVSNALVGVFGEGLVDNGTVAEVDALLSNLLIDGGATTNAINLHVQTPSSITTTTNLYGVKIEDQTGANNNWAIKTGLGLVDLGDTFQNASVTQSSLAAKLTANGQQIYCSDCKVIGPTDNTCTNGGTGAMAFRINGVNKCMQ